MATTAITTSSSLSSSWPTTTAKQRKHCVQPAAGVAALLLARAAVVVVVVLMIISTIAVTSPASKPPPSSVSGSFFVLFTVVDAFPPPLLPSLSSSLSRRQRSAAAAAGTRIIKPVLLFSSYNGNNNYAQQQQQQLQPQLDIDLNEDAYRDIETFQRWSIEQCGIQTSDGFQIYIDENDTDQSQQQQQVNYGIMTTTPLLEENSPVVFVPSNVILSSTRIKQEEFGTLEEAEQRLVSAKASNHVPQFYVFLKLLVELQNGQQSPYYPWFNSLPRYYSNGSSMTPFCFECLPPLAGFLAQKERIQYIQFFQALKYVENLGILDPTIAQSKQITKWAFAVVYTRGFQVERMDGSVDYKLIPMMDYFNHCSNVMDGGPEVYIQYDEEENAYAYTTRPISAGSPLRIQYGDPTNPSHLLARYGFLDTEASATFCKIMIPKPTQEQINMGYDHSRMLFYRETGDVSPEVYDVLLYELLGGNELQDYQTQRTFYEAHMTGDYETKQSILNAYWGQTQQALLDHIDNFLYDLDKLGQKGFGRSIDEHPRLPLIMSHNDFVKQTFLNVRSNIIMSQQQQ